MAEIIRGKVNFHNTVKEKSKKDGYKMIKTQDYRLGILKDIYIDHIKNPDRSILVSIKTRKEALAYRYLQRRGFINLKLESSDELQLKIILLQSGVDYIRNLEKELG
ncbi:hypothetical protein P4S95_00480 [Aneurinibacillus aneurinilyticus]|uniref:hypothetical protein n=1 Tax=Aneurinibacillus aneurinilyticus TaxID=1391 RepID=UPI002E1F0AB1|nr:hypothetical protein [Aneurinibacillus aneurinilyticus]